MLQDPLTQVLALLLAALLVVALARRIGLPPVLGYLIVGVLVGPYVLGILDDSNRIQLLAEVGVVFLLFTLGLEFSWPRMVAMRREVFGLGLAQVLVTMALFVGIGRALELSWLVSLVIGGALSMSSTAIVIRQLSEQAELNRTHGRLTFAILLFQDLAFVPLLALAGVLADGGPTHFDVGSVAKSVAGGLVALLIVMVAGRFLMRPLFVEMANSRLRELFTLAVLFVVLGSAWITEHAGLSLALGGFLAGMLLAETEYRHQVEAVIRPFRELLLGLFFISVGMLLDVQLIRAHFLLVSGIVVGMILLKVLAATLAVRGFVSNWFKALRTGVLQGGGGEFGVALLIILIKAPESVAPNSVAQPMLLALVVTMLIAPFGIRYNKTLARFLLREKGPPQRAVERLDAATLEVGRREHVILCGYGRVGQNIARVLESQGFEYIAVDLDPHRVMPARQAGHPVIFGDSSDEDVLESCGLANASALVVSFADAAVSLSIVRAVRRLRADVPVLVRTADDGGIDQLRAVGATEVVPETFEASLMLAAHTLMALNMSIKNVVGVMDQIRRARYATLRSVLLPYTPGGAVEGDEGQEGISSIVIPPLAWSVGRSLQEVRARGAEVAFTAIRRRGITGREPSDETVLQGGDVLVVYGQPQAIEHAEAILLAG